MKEIWKQVAEDERYQISSRGNVRSFSRNKVTPHQMVKWIDKDGYLKVGLRINNRQRNRLVSRLVAQAFIPNPEGKSQVNHKNGVRDDNRLENLEWATVQENNLHGWRVNGRKMSVKQLERSRARFGGVNNPKAKITFQIAEEIRRLRKTGKKLRELACIYNISMSQISTISKGEHWKLPV